MIEDLKQYLVSSVVAIRYRQNFSIVDKFGTIIDEILYDKKTFFKPEDFQFVQHTKADEKVLFNKDNRNNLKINTSNIILEINIDEENDPDYKKNAFNAFDKQIVQGVLKKNKIVQINRIGYINRYVFPIKELAENFINKTIGSTIDNVRDINLRFSRKYPIAEAQVKKEVYDYHNSIYNAIKQSDKDEIFFSVDFQRYFDPFLESSSLIEFSQFCNHVEHHNEKIFLPWINDNYKVIK